jgi:hypothetical protein
MKNTFKFALVGALLATMPVVSAADCYAISKLAAKEITANPSHVLKIVSQQISANEACACEVVKAAIVVTEANKQLVAKIVEQAIEAAPKSVSLITTCALAVAPDAHAEVMEVAAKYSKGSGEGYSSKSGDSAKKGIDNTNNDNTTNNDNKPIAKFSPLDFVGLDGTGNFSPVSINFIPGEVDGFGATTPSNPYSQP